MDRRRAMENHVSDATGIRINKAHATIAEKRRQIPGLKEIIEKDSNNMPGPKTMTMTKDAYDYNERLLHGPSKEQMREFVHFLSFIVTNKDHMEEIVTSLGQVASDMINEDIKMSNAQSDPDGKVRNQLGLDFVRQQQTQAQTTEADMNDLYAD
jgi:hypothetical protein